MSLPPATSAPSSTPPIADYPAHTSQTAADAPANAKTSKSPAAGIKPGTAKAGGAKAGGAKVNTAQPNVANNETSPGILWNTTPLQDPTQSVFQLSVGTQNKDPWAAKHNTSVDKTPTSRPTMAASALQNNDAVNKRLHDIDLWLATPRSSEEVVVALDVLLFQGASPQEHQYLISRADRTQRPRR